MKIMSIRTAGKPGNFGERSCILKLARGMDLIWQELPDVVSLKSNGSCKSTKVKTSILANHSSRLVIINTEDCKSLPACLLTSTHTRHVCAKLVVRGEKLLK